MKHLTFSIVCLGFCLTGCATSGISIINNPASNLSEIKKNADECNAAAKDPQSEFRQSYYRDPNNSVAQNAAGSFGAGAAKGYLQAKQEIELAWACLDERGFKRSWLSEAEMEEYNALKSKEEKRAYLERLSLAERPESSFVDPSSR